MRTKTLAVLTALAAQYAGSIAAEEGASQKPLPLSDVSPAVAPRPAQIEPVVPPVKRSAPKMPASIAKSNAGAKATDSKDHDCGKGARRAKPGGGCVTVVDDTSAGKKPDRTAKKK